MKECHEMRQMTAQGRQIESSSFDVIDAEFGPHDFNEQEYEVVRRIIHTTADFEYKHLMRFSEDAISAGIEALKNGCNIISDTRMIATGLNPQRLATYGCKTFCYVSDDDVIATAQESGVTRSIEAIKKAHSLGQLQDSIIAVGNAPTALLEVLRIYREEGVKPALIVGVPVGFISAVESKEELLNEDINYILSRGRKGGTTIAVSIIHALLKLSVD